jgi:hypothetical protein
VSYQLSGSGPPGVAIKASLIQGRIDCKAPAAADTPALIGGVLEVNGFKTGGWDDFKFLGATPLTVEAGNGQLFTLCFEKASWVVLNALCIAEDCP